MNIWQELKKPFFVLAPMEAVTDHVFRRIVHSAAPADLYFSEFTNATGWVHAGEKAVAGRLTIHPEEDYPLIAQIWCSEPDDIAQLAQYCKKLGYKGIDLNMGCPAKTAVKNSGGSAMIRQPELAAEIIAAAKTAELPVSVKTRLGYTSVEEWQTWLSHLLKQDISALTVHLRSKKEMSKVPAHWELMPEIKKLRDEIAPETLIIGNGDVRDRAHGQELIDQSGIDGIMIGRGVFTNIFAFEQTPKEHSKEELLKLLNTHLDLFEAAHTVRHPSENWDPEIELDPRLRGNDGTASVNDIATGDTTSDWILSQAENYSDAITEKTVISSGVERSTTTDKQICRQARDDTNVQHPTSNVQYKPYQTLKRFFKIYIREFPGSHELRSALMETNYLQEARDILKNHSL